MLGELEKPAFSAEIFLRKVNDLVTAERFETARRLIRRYPDLALETLRNATSAEASRVALQTIARIHDQQCGSSNPAEGWLALLQDRTAHPDRYAAYETSRQRYLDLRQNGKAQDATAVPLVKHAPKGLLEIDAYQLLGEAYLLAGKPADAMPVLTRGLQIAQNGHPYQAAQVMLLLGEAQRRAGKRAEGTGTWQQAVLLCGQLLTRPVPVLDPLVWERASYLRPVQSSWPDPVIKQLMPSAGPGQLLSDKMGLDEAWLWAHLGRWHLDRSEPQAALAACKRAEGLNLDKNFQDQMQLLQARALIQLQQRDAAMALLAGLGGSPNRAAAPPALAMLASLRLTDGSAAQALTLLKKAVEESPSPDWPGRGEAEADLGLACLMTGDEASGLRWLHSGQQHFEAERDHELLLLSLDNEARYFEHSHKPEEAARKRQRMKVLEKD